MKASGFVPTNFQLKPPYISFALVLIGLGFTGLSFVLYYMSREMELGLLPPVTLYLGLALFICTLTYLWNRHRKKAEAKRADEIKFKNWAKEQYNVVLTNDQVEQLFYYGSTFIENSKWVLHYELPTNGDPIGYLYSAAQWQEAVTTEIINTIDEDEKHTPHVPLVDDDEFDEEEDDDEEENINTAELDVEPVEPVIGSTSTDATPTEPIPVQNKVISIEDVPQSITKPAYKPETQPETQPETKFDTSKTVSELKAEAKEAGIKGYSRLNKQQLIYALTHQNAQ